MDDRLCQFQKGACQLRSRRRRRMGAFGRQALRLGRGRVGAVIVVRIRARRGGPRRGASRRSPVRPLPAGLRQRSGGKSFGTHELRGRRRPGRPRYLDGVEDNRNRRTAAAFAGPPSRSPITAQASRKPNRCEVASSFVLRTGRIQSTRCVRLAADGSAPFRRRRQPELRIPRFAFCLTAHGRDAVICWRRRENHKFGFSSFEEEECYA
jgi:hypothetical protein